MMALVRRPISFLFLIIIVLVLVGNSRHLSNDGVSPHRNGLSIVYTVHPNGDAILFPIASGDQRGLEPKVVFPWKRKGVLHFPQCWWSALLSGLGSQKDIGVELRISVLGEEIAGDGKRLKEAHGRIIFCRVMAGIHRMRE
jgi:hypothetical protein